VLSLQMRRARRHLQSHRRKSRNEELFSKALRHLAPPAFRTAQSAMYLVLRPHGR
jgi:hypothetical protein